MSKQMTKLMPWVGGKAQLMWAIQMLLPTHYKTLVDVFGGSGIITMNTSVPSGCLQIYNDLNHDLYNLLFCAKERPLELVRELGFLPINAHDEFDVLQRQLQGEEFTIHFLGIALLEEIAVALAPFSVTLRKCAVALLPHTVHMPEGMCKVNPCKAYPHADRSATRRRLLVCWG